MRNNIQLNVITHYVAIKFFNLYNLYPLLIKIENYLTKNKVFLLISPNHFYKLSLGSIYYY